MKASAGRPSPRRFVPDRGDTVWLVFDPKAGHEQSGRRPALVLSPREYNDRVGLALVCPITSHIKGYPFEVQLPASSRMRGVILVDQLKSLDWKSRSARRIGSVSAETVEQVVDLVDLLLRG